MMYYKCHQVNSRNGSSYIDSLNWIEKAIKNPKDKDDKCF